MESREGDVGVKGFSGRMRRFGKEIVTILKPQINSEPGRVPLEGIDDSSVAVTIQKHITSHIRGKATINPRYFTFANVIRGLGYGVLPKGADYRQRFPEESQRTENALDDLWNDGVLEKSEVPKPGIDGEIIHYKILDQAELEKIAQSAQRSGAAIPK